MMLDPHYVLAPHHKAMFKEDDASLHNAASP